VDARGRAELRKWFGHDPARGDEFRRRYRAELDGNPEAVQRCMTWYRRGPMTLLYAAQDKERNQAVVLREYLSERATKEEKGHVLPR
jgi:uncharacterized protein YeaO (DUF488 family)